MPPPQFPPAVEAWRQLVEQYKDWNPDVILLAMQGESGGQANPSGNPNHYGPLQSTNPLAAASPAAAIAIAHDQWAASLAAYPAGQGYAPWGYNNSYQGQPFGALGITYSQQAAQMLSSTPNTAQQAASPVPQQAAQPAAQAAQHPLQGTPSPSGRTFAQITGTDYQSDEERAWYLAQIGHQVGASGQPEKFTGSQPATQPTAAPADVRIHATGIPGQAAGSTGSTMTQYQPPQQVGGQAVSTANPFAAAVQQQQSTAQSNTPSDIMAGINMATVLGLEQTNGVNNPAERPGGVDPDISGLSTYANSLSSSLFNEGMVPGQPFSGTPIELPRPPIY